MNWGAGVWLVLLIVFLLTEAATVTLVSLWFAVGALAAMLASLFDAQVWLQMTVFLVVSSVSLLAMRPLIRKHLKPKIVKTNVDAVIGTTGIVIARIDNRLSCGRVKLGAMEWTARSTNGEKLNSGTQIVVDRIEGVKVFVSPVEQKETIQSSR